MESESFPSRNQGSKKYRYDRSLWRYYRDFSGKMGIVGTPVIDSATGTLYLVSRNVSQAVAIFNNGCMPWISPMGAEKSNSPVLITATYTGSSAGSVGGYHQL
ncbi:MAG: hypothetical protein C5B59_16280 [Bacteroidetes bacterium]|nr:MAG: hypothetical protein C5B59_16280 [Bacteroidota bacterium]